MNLLGKGPLTLPARGLLSIIGKRLLQALFVAWAVGSITFVLMRLLPGDAAYRIAASRYGYDYVNVRAAEAVRAELGLDRPALEVYGRWLFDLLRLRLGNSLISGQSVLHEISRSLHYSVQLAGLAMLFSLLLAVPVGIACGKGRLRAEHRGKRSGLLLDHFVLFVSIFIRVQPVFVVGLLLLLIFALGLGIFPVAGYGSGPDSLRYLMLPALSLALGSAAVSNRIVRNATMKVCDSPYYLFARLKGLNDEQAFERHARLNIALPLISFIGIQTVTLIEGIVMIESLFSWPGIGHALAHSIFGRDIPMIQGAALLMGLLFVLVNTVTDLLHYLLDPRLHGSSPRLGLTPESASESASGSALTLKAPE
ncbi:ABC transporter permease [Candidatus Haliotispira prima]|uniref:ABC transporter permease n=1 Tax=Candidatus Haliotispira prima TaxID=3034016 RepID=A0ABY8MF67_9SPIO|nr:ABC transporter permease [Candidatus Haliotispira prima]